jgi:tetratricopeptide (TPR) repeat protein
VTSPISESPVFTSPPLAGERLAFTGVLASMTHKQAQTRVAECGGTSSDHVSRQTTMLVVGEEGWPLEPDGAPSVKLQQVERWRAEGLDIRIVRESEWLGFVGLDGHRGEQLYTPAMLSQALGISVHQVRRWERLGLIHPVSRVYRLPYFDFREVSGVRRLAQLIEAGVPIREIKSGLDRLQDLIGNVERPLAQLELLAGDHHMLFRDAEGRLKTTSGQILLDFEPPQSSDEFAHDDIPAVIPMEEPDRSDWTAADWLDEARRLVDTGIPRGAVEACRLSLMEDHDAPEAHFLLAEALFRLDNPHGALERYYVATELDHNYLEAWTQLGCVHAGLGDHESAISAFRIALDVHSDYPDAHLHLAEALRNSGRTAEAIPHWQTYLQFDHRGPWADAARQRLRDAGFDVPDGDPE